MDDGTAERTPRSSDGASRRSIMKGVAWAAPMAAVAVAAPAVAASPKEPIDVDLSDLTCKETKSSKKYYLAFDIRNIRTFDVEFRITSLVVEPNSGSNITFPGQIPTNWISLGDLATITVGFTSDESGNIANGTAVATFEVRDPSGEVETFTGTFRVPTLSPCPCVPMPCEA